MITLVTVGVGSVSLDEIGEHINIKNIILEM